MIFLIAEKVVGSDADKEVRLLANRCDLERYEMQGLRLVDYQQIENAYQ